MTLAYQFIEPDLGCEIIDIGSQSRHPLAAHLSYYDATPKQLPEGKGCRMYAGYYYYLITVGDNTRFLRAATLDDLDVKRRYDWTNVPGLPRLLERALLYNLRASPLAIPYIVHNNVKVVWKENRPLRNAEQRWLRVVQATLERIKREHRG